MISWAKHSQGVRRLFPRPVLSVRGTPNWKRKEHCQESLPKKDFLFRKKVDLLFLSWKNNSHVRKKGEKKGKKGTSEQEKRKGMKRGYAGL